MTFVLHLIAAACSLAQPQTLVFEGATLIDGNGGPPMSNAWIVTSGERITHAGPRRPGNLPPTARRVDLKGKFVIPGMFDMHTHVDEPELIELKPKKEEKEQWLPLFVLLGVTSIREMAGSLELLQEWRARIGKGELLGPRIWAGGPLVDGPKPMWPESIAVTTPDQGREVVRDLKRRGADFVKAYSLLPRDAFFAICDEAKKQGIPVCGHVPQGITNREAAEAGLNSLEHMLGLPQELADQDKVRSMRAEVPNFGQLERGLRYRRNTEILEKAYDSAKAASLFALFKQRGIWIDPTLTVGYRNFTFTTGDPAIESRKQYVPAFIREWWDPGKNVHLQNRSDDLSVGGANLHRLLGRILRDMKAAGIPLMTGSDMGGNPHCFAGWGVHDELRLLVEAGLSPMDALVAATSNPAKYLGASDRLGSVEAGKFADFVILSADPLMDIRNSEKIEGVVYSGRYFDKTEIKRRMARQRTDVAKRL